MLTAIPLDDDDCRRVTSQKEGGGVSPVRQIQRQNSIHLSTVFSKNVTMLASSHPMLSEGKTKQKQNQANEYVQCDPVL